MKFIETVKSLFLPKIWDPIDMVNDEETWEKHVYPLKIYTAQYNYRGPDRYDITIKSGHPIFAPTWDMVNGYKKGTLTKEDYTSQYLNKMLNSFKDYRIAWETILNRERVVFVCYCKAGDFCHRLLLASYFAQLGGTYEGEING